MNAMMHEVCYNPGRWDWQNVAQIDAMCAPFNNRKGTLQKTILDLNSSHNMFVVFCWDVLLWANFQSRFKASESSFRPLRLKTRKSVSSIPRSWFRVLGNRRFWIISIFLGTQRGLWHWILQYTVQKWTEYLHPISYIYHNSILFA